MSMNTTVVEIVSPMPAIEAISKHWTPDQVMVTNVEDHGHTTLQHWNKLINLIGDPGSEYAIDGESLDLATVVAVAR